MCTGKLKLVVTGYNTVPEPWVLLTTELGTTKQPPVLIILCMHCTGSTECFSRTPLSYLGTIPGDGQVFSLASLIKHDLFPTESRCSKRVFLPLLSPTSPPCDEVIHCYEEHEDSVYSAVWSAADAWVFASLSYDGRLVINHVPSQEKFSILTS